MTRFVLIATVVGMLASSLGPAAAQDTTVTVEVQTRSGLSLRLAQPIVEVRYTVVRPPSGGSDAAPPGGQAPPGAGAGLGTMAGGGSEPQIIGSASGLAKMFTPGPEPLRAQREKNTLTLFSGETELRIPIDRLASLTVSRQRVSQSPLPPYIAPTHVRHAAVAVLVDGSTVEGDYVSFGTAVLSGTTPQGRIELPLDDIEHLRFSR